MSPGFAHFTHPSYMMNEWKHKTNYWGKKWSLGGVHVKLINITEHTAAYSGHMQEHINKCPVFAMWHPASSWPSNDNSASQLASSQLRAKACLTFLTPAGPGAAMWGRGAVGCCVYTSVTCCPCGCGGLIHPPSVCGAMWAACGLSMIRTSVDVKKTQ